MGEALPRLIYLRWKIRQSRSSFQKLTIARKINTYGQETWKHRGAFDPWRPATALPSLSFVVDATDDLSQIGKQRQRDR